MNIDMCAPNISEVTLFGAEKSNAVTHTLIHIHLQNLYFLIRVSNIRIPSLYYLPTKMREM